MAAGVPGAAIAADVAPATTVLVTAATVQAPAPRRAVDPHRVRPAAAAAAAATGVRLDDPRSMLQRSFGGSMIDLFPIEGGNLHLSGGGRLYGRAGRPRPIATDPESMRYLPPFRAGALRGNRRINPVMLVGYGRTVEQGLAIGFDAGVAMGRLGAIPDRVGRLNRRRLDSIDGRGRRTGANPLARVTALYRF